MDVKPDVEAEIDELYKLPLAEFTAARNALAGRLKKAGLRDDSDRVKLLGKPSVSAWAANQLYWKHRDSFDHLMTAAERVGQAHASQVSGKPADTRGALTARREALSNLSRLADKLLRDSGHNPSPDTLRRITTTLEGLSSQSPETHHLGRLAEDVDPPGFESLAAFIPTVERLIFPKVEPPPPKKEAIPPKVAAARAVLDAAESKLREARVKAQELAAALEDASKRSHDAESQLTRAQSAAEEARKRLSRVTADAEKAAAALKDSERKVDEARKKLDSIE